MATLSYIEGFKSNSQRIRKMTEFWTGENIYCPCCGDTIVQYSNNKPVADFYCKNCEEDFELKSKKAQNIGKIIPDGSYKTMIERLESSKNPSFFFLTYKPNLEVSNFLIIPKFFIRPENIIQAPRILKDRGEYMMCNISLGGIPESGKIHYIKNSEVLKKEEVIDDWKKTCFLEQTKGENKGWLLDIMRCIDTLGKKNFTLNEMKVFVPMLQKKYPNNHHVEDKIRQKLQVLRDKGYLEFKGGGKYKIF